MEAGTRSADRKGSVMKRFRKTLVGAALAVASVIGAVGATAPAGAATAYATNSMLNGYGAVMFTNVSCTGSYFTFQETSVLGAAANNSAFRLWFYSYSTGRWSNPSAWVYPSVPAGYRTFQYHDAWSLPQWNIPAFGTGNYAVYAEVSFRDAYGRWTPSTGFYLNQFTNTYGGASQTSTVCNSQQGGW
jgi:hypothetical protein